MTSINTGLIRWRIGPQLKSKPGFYQLLAYIDARTAMTLLDEQLPGWSTTKPEAVYENDRLVAFITGITDADGVTRYDVGTVSSMEPIKGAMSDSLKRAAQAWGIGRELYDQPLVYTTMEADKSPTSKPRWNNETGRWEIDPPGWVWYPDEEREVPELARTNKDKVRDLARAMKLDKEALRQIAQDAGIDFAPDHMAESAWGKLFTAMVARQVGGTIED